MIDVHEGEFLRVHVPTYLEHSLQSALGGVHAPFFAGRAGRTVRVILRGDEWERLAPRFASARREGGFRLISVRPCRGGADLPGRLAAVLDAEAAPAVLLPAFHGEYFLVAEDTLERTLAAIRRCLDAATIG